MKTVYRKVVLPDGRKVVEEETVHHSELEIQFSYWYLVTLWEHPWKVLDVSKFATDYWGRVDGVVFL